jgi:hypothetical protein
MLMDITRDLPIISSISALKYFSKSLIEEDIINVLSDIKHRISPRPFERLSSLRNKKMEVVWLELKLVLMEEIMLFHY